MPFYTLIKCFLKTNSRYTITTIGLIVFLFVTVSFKKQDKSTDDSQAVLTLKNLYTAYMSAFSIKDLKKAENIMLQLRPRYLTVNAKKDYKRIGDEQDMDPIINGQDSDEKWAKTLRFKRDQKNPNVYYVTYSSPYLDKKYKEQLQLTKIKLLLTKENGQYKIDHILYPIN